MKRRHFLHYFAALKAQAFDPRIRTIRVQDANALLSLQTYQRAEQLIKAQRHCNISMIERLLNVDVSTSKILRHQLIQNGIINATKSAYGMHSVLRPISKNILSRRTLLDNLYDYFIDRKPKSLVIKPKHQQYEIEQAETLSRQQVDSEQIDR